MNFIVCTIALCVLALAIIAGSSRLLSVVFHNPGRASFVYQRTAEGLRKRVLSTWTTGQYGRRLLVVAGVRHSIRYRFSPNQTRPWSGFRRLTVAYAACLIMGRGLLSFVDALRHLEPALILRWDYHSPAVCVFATVFIGLLISGAAFARYRSLCPAPRARAAKTLFIRAFENRSWILDVDSETTVNDVLQACRTRYGSYRGPLALYLASRRLASGAHVEALGLDSLSPLNIRLGLPGGAPERTQKTSHNHAGSNQYRDTPLLEEYPCLPSYIQQLIYEGVKVKDLPQTLDKKFGISIALRSVERIKKDFNIKTFRRNNGSAQYWFDALVEKQNEIDPLRRFGAHDLQDAMRESEILIPRNFVAAYLRETDENASLMRRANVAKKHTAGLWSIGPDEEWSFDGHEKLLQCMDLAIYGGVDKYSRFKLGMYIVSRHQQPDVGMSVFLLCVHQHGRSPLQTISDMGTETPMLAAMQRELFKVLFPLLNPEEIQPHQFRKSTENITVERQWRILYTKILANILDVYIAGQHDAGFLKTRPVHRLLARWIWAQAVQKRVDEHVKQHNNHRIRLQKINLPSGMRPVDAYENPEQFGGWRPRAEKLDAGFTKELVDRYVSADIFRFGTEAEVAIMENEYRTIGSPPITVLNAWAIFRRILGPVEFAMADLDIEEQFEDYDVENVHPDGW